MDEASTISFERSKVGFDQDAVAAWWVGGREKLLSRQKVSEALRQDPDFVKIPEHDIYRLSKVERYHRGSERFALAMRKLASGEIFKPPYNLSTKYEHEYFLSRAIGPDGTTMGITYAMFIPTIMNQASEEQKKVSD